MFSQLLNKTSLKELLAKRDSSFYLYDLEILKNQVKKLKSVLPDFFEISYSLKANAHPEILKTLALEKIHYDVASKGEIELASLYCPNCELSFVGPGKTKKELDFAQQKNVSIFIVESLEEIEKLITLKKEGQIVLRANTKFHWNEVGQRRQSPLTQFGLSQSDLKEAYKKIMDTSHLHFIGLHFHRPGFLTNALSLAKNIGESLSYATFFAQETGARIQYLNFGGGFGIPYTAGGAKIDLGPLKDELSNLAPKKSFPDCRFIVESGRFISGPCGFYLTPIVDIKKNEDKNFIIVEGGYHQHAAACGVGQVLRHNFPHMTFPSRSGEEKKYDVCGSTCYHLDQLLVDTSLIEPEIGDWIILAQSGAYGRSFSPGDFLHKGAADEVFV